MLALRIVLFVLSAVFLILGICSIFDGCFDNDDYFIFTFPAFVSAVAILAIAILLCLKLYLPCKIVLAVLGVALFAYGVFFMQFFYKFEDLVRGLCIPISILIILGDVVWFTNVFGLVGKKTQNSVKTEMVSEDSKSIKNVQKNIQKQKKSDSKKFNEPQTDDVELLESLGNVKLSQQDLLISTSEPVMYVVAPMTYDTTMFVADARYEDGSFGKMVDNSKERLILLKTCITDFESKIDAKTGVSFLDRSKIEQIEKEHKFQLGDWSNSKKTAELGMALNANILLFLDSFGYLDSEYRFNAKFVDINTMQFSAYTVIYKNPKGNLKTPEIVDSINFKGFTAVSTKKNPFNDGLVLKKFSSLRTSQRLEDADICPFGSVAKLSFSENDPDTPENKIAKAKELNFDGLGSLEIVSDDGTESKKYIFEPVEMKLVRDGYSFYTDGKIGTLYLQDDSYQAFDVYTQNGNDYFINVGSKYLKKVQVNYFVRFSKE